jgi:hypothetical protein
MTKKAPTSIRNNLMKHYGLGLVRLGRLRRATMTVKSTDAERQKMNELRHKALVMRDQGLDSQEIANKLGLRTMTVAAWLAHRTMGTYGKNW